MTTVIIDNEKFILNLRSNQKNEVIKQIREELGININYLIQNDKSREVINRDLPLTCMMRYFKVQIGDRITLNLKEGILEMLPRRFTCQVVNINRSHDRLLVIGNNFMVSIGINDLSMT